MKNTKTALLVATIMASNSLALASVSSLENLKESAQIKSTGDLTKLLSKADQATAQDLIMTYNEVQKLAESLRAIQNSNEKDPVLNYANKFQVVLVGASAIAINSHIKNSEKSRISLHIAAASALLNTFIRHYSEVKNLKPNELGVFISRFTHEMTETKALTPEMMDLANSLNTISNDLLTQKSQIDSIVGSLGGGSDLATIALLALSITHYLNPKLAKEGEAIIKTMSQKVAAGGATLAKDSKILGATGSAAGLPDLIGITLGLDSQKSQEMISKTLNNLDIAARTLQVQMNQK